MSHELIPAIRGRVRRGEKENAVEDRVVLLEELERVGDAIEDLADEWESNGGLWTGKAIAAQVLAALRDEPQPSQPLKD